MIGEVGGVEEVGICFFGFGELVYCVVFVECFFIGGGDEGVDIVEQGVVVVEVVCDLLCVGEDWVIVECDCVVEVEEEDGVYGVFFVGCFVYYVE